MPSYPALKNLRPMLAAKAPEDLDTLRLPAIASPKLDGFRLLMVTPDWYRRTVGENPYADDAEHALAVTRALKPLANKATQRLLDRPELVGFDGELTVGEPTNEDVFKLTTSALRRVAGEPDVQFHVFDDWRLPGSFEERLYSIAERWNVPDFVRPVEQVRIKALWELEELEAQFLADGYEGVIIRNSEAPYKFGRSTAEEQGMLKLKRFTDDEAVILGFKERMHNANEAVTNELGYTSRSTHQENKVGTGMLGAFKCRNASGQTFNVGTGMTEAERIQLWSVRDTLSGKILKYKSFMIGTQDAPRHPVYLGLRADEDL